MSTLKTSSSLVLDALKALGIQTERLKEIHIHIEPEDIVRADCVYYVTEPPLFSIEKFNTIVKKYELHFEEIKTK
jgi:hypothetical protein